MMIDKELLQEQLDRQADFIAGLKYEDLPDEAIDQAKRILLDSIACIAVGNSEYIEDAFPEGGYPLIGKRRISKCDSILLNASAMVKNELDEGNQFAFGHPACHIVPSFLAECQDINPTGKDAITALVAAYEVSCRWGGATKLKSQMHVHGTSQTLGAAAVCCKLKKRDRASIVKSIVLANSLPQATTWTSAFHGDQLRNIYIGLSNLVGSMASNMIDAGIESSVDSLLSVWQEVLDGEIDFELLSKDIGKNYLITKNYFKLHSACRYTHSFVDMVNQVMTEGVKIGNIEKIEIETYSAASKLKSQEVENAFAAKFSIPVALATNIVKGSLSVGDITDENIKDPQITELAKKIEVNENKDFTKLLPDVRRNHMRIVQKDGKVIEKDSSVTKGDYLDPFDNKELVKKFKSLTKNIWDEKSQEVIIDYISHLEEKENIQDLIKMTVNDK